MSDIDIGQLSEAINDKADRDLNNTQPLARVSSKDILPSWYRVYSDGWCEQGGKINPSIVTTVTVSLLKTYKDTNYLIITDYWGTSTAGPNTIQNAPKNITNISFGLEIWSDMGRSWQTSGYIS